MADDNTNSDNNQILSEIPTPQPKNWRMIITVILLVVVAISSGAGSAYLFWDKQYASGNVKSASFGTGEESKPPEPQKDEKTFRDKAEGTMERNDTSGQYSQGTHKLIRSGGPSQTVYLVSSVVDLDQFVGKKVVVWGETNHSTQVGWLMDVGKVEKAE